MIGPVDSYQAIYVAVCGLQFANSTLGRDHERECAECKGEPIEPEDIEDM
jgi:hypothetical protein